MTAEVLIMNKMAAALAADSAVTIAGKKVYNSANKLFAISKYAPVGVMVFGNAEFMSFPWETVIKLYRDQLGTKEFDRLPDYSADFFRFLKQATFISRSDEDAFAHQAAVTTYLALRDRLAKFVQQEINQNGSITEQRTIELTQHVLDQAEKLAEESPLRPTLTKQFEKRLPKKFSVPLLAPVASVFENLPLTDKQRTQLARIVALSVSRGLFSANSGLVIAGFGRLDLFPSMVTSNIDGRISNELIQSPPDIQSISAQSNAFIRPFAQGEMVNTFMEGVDPSLAAMSSTFIERVFTDFPKNIIEHLQPSEKAGITEKLEQASKELFRTYQEQLRQYQREQHINPVLNAVAALPKDELAAMAEALVNLTSFKRKVTIETETVGGAIDVAVISKGDGFIWIKRKHYFKPELNHHFATNYFRKNSNEQPTEKND
jgi:hypothetical protein